MSGIHRIFIFSSLAILLFLKLVAAEESGKNSELDFTFRITISNKFSGDEFTGRMLLLISNNDNKEPRFQINSNAGTQLVFGVDVVNFKTGDEVVFDENILGFPLLNISNIPAGEYFVQGLLHKYDTFDLVSGKTVWLPMDQGEGQQWNKSPHNLYSTPRKVRIDPEHQQIIKIELDLEIPPIKPPKDTKYIKHIRIKSERLTEFWGRPMFLQANVLVPFGFEKTSDTHYPLMVFHGHFPYTFGGFREIPPDADPNDSTYSDRFRIYSYEFIQQKEAHDFYKRWVSKDFPRYVIIEIQHQNPYYDDSYAVNSANLGPYGDAITYELIPHIEKLFNCVGEGWGRFLYGGSTGGWEALAVQVYYPDDYNGCFAACPDPIDFRAYTVVDIYKDRNAYFIDSDFKKTFRPGTRDYQGHIQSTMEEENIKELVIGTHSRSGGQWDIWEAVYSPSGEDGYPKRIWNKLNGVIDPEVAEYWKENYDLRYILERDWHKIGNKLEGKIHIYCGDMDNYYLNNAVKLMEAFLEKTTDPYYGGEIGYGDGHEHCWNGDYENPNHISRLRYNTMYLPKIQLRLKKTAPKNNRLENWGF